MLKSFLLVVFLFFSFILMGQNIIQSIGSEFYCFGSCSDPRDVIVWNDELHVSGKLFKFNGIADNNLQIVKWDGVMWNTLGNAVFNNGSTQATILKMFSTQNFLYVCGKFTNLDGDTNFANIAKWDGCNWFPIGNGIDNGEVRDIATVDDQNIFVGGDFHNAGGNAEADDIAVWDGTNWHSLDGGGTNSLSCCVNSLKFWNGDLYVGGNFICKTLPNDQGISETFRTIAKWDGTNWFPLADVECNLNGQVHDLEVFNSLLYAVGDLRTGCYPNQYEYDVVSYNGSAFVDVGQNAVFSNMIFKISEFDQELIIGGTFEGDHNNIEFEHLAKLKGGYWQSFDFTLNHTVRGMVEHNEELIIVGGFSNVNDQSYIDRVAKYGEDIDYNCTNSETFEYIDSILKEGNQGFFRSTREDYHYYQLEDVEICNTSDPNCSLANVWNALKSEITFQVPKGIDFKGQYDFSNDSELENIIINNCLEYDVPAPPKLVQFFNGFTFWGVPIDCSGGFGDILSPDPIKIFINEFDYSITNYTLEGHSLYPGKVTRYLFDDGCEHINIRTVGTGFHFCGDNASGKRISKLNDSLGRKAFINVTQRFINNY